MRLRAAPVVPGRAIRRILRLPRQREGGLTSAFGGIADHARTCRWFNPVVMRKSAVGSWLAPDLVAAARGLLVK
jgi:hypothetical protein